MKKTLTLLFFTLLLIFSGCSSKSNLEEAYAKMETVDSYRVDMKMDNIPLVGSMSITIKQDGDMLYTSNPFFEQGIYQKMIDGETYDYELQEDGSYILSSTPSGETEDETDYIDELDYTNFSETDDNTWVSNSERIYLDDEETDYLEDIIITLNDDGYFDTIQFTLTAEGVTMDIELVYSGYNTTTVELPTSN